MPIKALLFDLDETLHPFNTVEDEVRDVQSRMLSEQFKLTPEEILRVHQRTLNTQIKEWGGQKLFARPEGTTVRYLREAWGKTFQQLGIDPGEELIEDLAHGHLEERLRRLRFYPDALECLRWGRANYKMGLISNGPIDSQRRHAEALDVLEFFDTAVFEGEAGIGKPDPEIFEMICRKLECAPGETVMIGDNLKNDVMGARQVGCWTVWLNREGEANGGDIQPHAVIKSLDELPAAVARFETESTPA